VRGSRVIKKVAVSLIILPPVPAYVVASELANVEPESTANGGEVVVLEPSPGTDHHVMLVMAANASPTRGAPATATYTIAVCGAGSFSGLLYLAGDAAMRKIDAIGPTGEQINVQEVHDATLTGMDKDIPVQHETQLISLDIPSPPQCIGESDTQGADAFFGSGYIIQGELIGEIARRVEFANGAVAGAREWQAWPTVGGFRSTSSQFLGEFVGTDELDGRWVRPGFFTVQVTAPISIGQSIESAAPPVEPSGALAWSAHEPISPTVRIVDVDALVKWQQVVLYLGLWIAVGLSVLGTVLLDWLRTSNRDDCPVPPVPARAAKSTTPIHGVLRPQVDLVSRPKDRQRETEEVHRGKAVSDTGVWAVAVAIAVVWWTVKRIRSRSFLN
jgi:hypothetical protein